MHVRRFCDFDRLTAWASDWDRLASGNPFRSWAWMSTWWRHYGATSPAKRWPRLYVLAVFDEAERLCGIAPWYADRCPIRGRILRFLGTGEVCSEYLGVLAAPDCQQAVAESLAAWLGQVPSRHDRWDLLELTAVDAEDQATGLLVESLRARACLVHSRPGPSCWRIDLPETWEAYLRMLSANHRKRIRNAENRLIRSGRAVFHLVRRPADLPHAQQMLIALHQQRRQMLGQPGCFASERFTAFHREVMAQLLPLGQLQLYWIEIDGTPAVAEYFLTGGGVVYAYQNGIAPDRMHLSPGQLGNMMGIRHALGSGCRALDFLRGDEAYKAHWRARPRPILEFRIAAPRLHPQLALPLWIAASRLKRWIRNRRHPPPPDPGEAEENHHSPQPEELCETAASGRR